MMIILHLSKKGKRGKADNLILHNWKNYHQQLVISGELTTIFTAKCIIDSGCIFSLPSESVERLHDSSFPLFLSIAAND